MAFRKEYETLVREKKLTTVFRPGNRLYPNYRGYKPEEIVTARIIEVLGCDKCCIAPVFNELKQPVLIRDITTLRIDELISADFSGSAPDVQSANQLIEHLELIYSKSLADFNYEVTRIRIVYLELISDANFIIS